MVRQLQAPSKDGRRRNERVIHSKKKRFWKRAKRPATTPAWTRHHFEECPHYSIVVFTQVAHNINKSQQKRELERHEIDQEWTRLIQGIYPADDPKSYEFLAQVGHYSEMRNNKMASLMHVSKVECPLYDGYWEKRADEKAFFERERRDELYGFNKSHNNPFRAQRIKWPGSIFIMDHGLKQILVPRIMLLALQQLNYLDFVKSVLQANPLIIISRFTMEELWVAVVTKIYHFEDALDKELKIGEVNAEVTPEKKTFH